MKQYLSFIAAVIFLCGVLTIPVIAHSGKTDSNGGHYDSSTGQYHYHHGYPAHQHTGSKCPYDYDDKTDHKTGSSKNSSKDSSGCSSSVSAVSSMALIIPCLRLIAKRDEN